MAETLRAIAERRMKEIRVRWRICNDAGGGLWFPASSSNRDLLEMWVKHCCDRAGPGSHWIEERDA